MSVKHWVSNSDVSVGGNECSSDAVCTGLGQLALSESICFLLRVGLV